MNSSQIRELLTTKRNWLIGIALSLTLIAIGVLAGKDLNRSEQRAATTSTTHQFANPNTSIDEEALRSLFENSPDTTIPEPELQKLTIGGAGTIYEQVGQTGAQVTLGILRVVKVDFFAKQYSPVFEETYHPTNGTFATFTIKAIGGDEALELSSSDFYVRISSKRFTTDDGNTTDLDTRDDALDNATLRNKEPLTATLTFDLPAKHGALVYSPNFDGQAVAEWSF